MGCCGQGRRVKQVKVGPFVPPKVTVGRPAQRPTARRREVGESCIYCGSKITEKVRKTPRGWIKRGWCATCKLEF